MQAHSNSLTTDVLEEEEEEEEDLDHH